MKYSYSWLKEISKINKSPEQVADALMMHSFEVEGIEKKGKGLEGVVVGQIKDIEKHPNADKLQIVRVFVEKIQNTKYKIPDTLTIVCGANNIKIGDKVPVALVGAKLSGGLEIKEAEIRGVKSFGMLCAEDELGLGKDHSGILILEKDAKVGEKVSEVLELNDTIFEIKVLPDRGHDALSHVGMAREVAALNNKKIDPFYNKLRLSAQKASRLEIEIKDKKLCPRYIGAVLENIKIQPSPAWVKNRLLALGIKPINNIVDATNFVMIEFGQPLHAFDLGKLANKEQIKSELVRIIVRRAKEGEEIKLLDGTVKELSLENLVIANEKKGLALAGIMGGEDSSISENTTAIVLESANFNATNIRRSRTRLNLKTEASDRYEKGIDPNLCEIAMARVIEIIKSFGATSPHRGKVDEIVDNYPSKVKPRQVKLDLEYVNRLLGEKISAKEAIKILNLLGLETSGKGKAIIVKIPTRRIDIRTQEDLIEEIGRLYGYEKIKPSAPLVSIKSPRINEKRKFERMVKNILAGDGFSEVYNYSFYSQKDAGLAQLGTVSHLELENPMNPSQALIRVSLIPNILKNIRKNLKNFNELHIFEIGKVFWPDGKKLPEEKNMLIGALILEKDKKSENFYEMKGYIDALFEKLGIINYYFDNFECTPEDSFSALWHPTRYAEIKKEGKNEKFGYMGEINPLVLANFDIHKRVVMFEFDMEKLMAISNKEREYLPLQKYPVSIRDISMISRSSARIDDILEVIQKLGGDLIIDVELFDIFDFEEKRETSFAFHIIFGSQDRTLQNKEIDELMKKITAGLEKEFEVEIRR